MWVQYTKESTGRGEKAKREITRLPNEKETGFGQKITILECVHLKSASTRTDESYNVDCRSFVQSTGP